MKRNIKLLEDYNPRPTEYRAEIHCRIPSFLEKVRGEQLAISFLLDSSFQQSRSTPASVDINDENLQVSVAAFKDTLIGD